MKTYTFEKLECWKHAKELAIWVYASTKGYPNEEKFGIVSQMRRAAISIASNLAEGTSRNQRRIRHILAQCRIAAQLNY